MSVGGSDVGGPHLPEDVTSAAASSFAQTHKQRFSVPWWLKLVGLAPFGIAAAGLLLDAFRRHDLRTSLAAAVVAVLGYLGWRKPGLVGGLLFVVTLVGVPFGVLVALYAGGSLYDWLLAEGVFGCVPLVSGLLLFVAARWRNRAS
jgi:hypothetical protein